MDADPIELACQDRRIKRAMHLVCRDLSTRRTTGQVARAVGLSNTHFCRRFHLITGMSFASWSTSIRIGEAKKLLKVIDLSITAVAATVGYSDVTTFARVFRKHELMCPREYRLTLIRSRTGVSSARESATRSANSEV